MLIPYSDLLMVNLHLHKEVGDCYFKLHEVPFVSAF